MCAADCCADERADARANADALDLSRPARTLACLERRLDLDFAAGRKRERSEGGLFDGDLALRAARTALPDAHVDAGTVDALVHVSTIPDALSQKAT